MRVHYVRLVSDVDPVVQAVRVAVDDIEPTRSLLEELDAFNTDVRFVRVFRVVGQVLVETDSSLSAATLLPHRY